MTQPEIDLRQPTPRPGPRWLRRIGIVLTAVLVIVVALVALLQLPPVATLVVRKLLTLAPINPGNRLEVGRVSGNFLRDLTLENLRLRQDGRELARIDRLTVGYHPARLRPPGTRLDEARDRRRRDRDPAREPLGPARGHAKSSDTTGGGGFAIDRMLVRDVAVAAELAPDSVAHARLRSWPYGTFASARLRWRRLTACSLRCSRRAAVAGSRSPPAGS